ncbi:hypothetical protein ACI8AF_20845 [Blastococcus sp. SYSU D00669]
MVRMCPGQVRAFLWHGRRQTALRAPWGGLAIASGANVKAVQSMLGHASAAMTLDRYSHLSSRWSAEQGAADQR